MSNTIAKPKYAHQSSSSTVFHLANNTACLTLQSPPSPSKHYASHAMLKNSELYKCCNATPILLTTLQAASYGWHPLRDSILKINHEMCAPIYPSHTLCHMPIAADNGQLQGNCRPAKSTSPFQMRKSNVIFDTERLSMSRAQHVLKHGAGTTCVVALGCHSLVLVNSTCCDDILLSTAAYLMY